MSEKAASLWRNEYFQWLPLEVAGGNSCPGRGVNGVALDLDLTGAFSHHPYPTIPPDPSTFTGMNIQKPKSSLSKEIGDT